jgi:purine-binding chemotaxis protein CheW
MSDSATASTSDEQVVVIELGGEAYGIEISRIQEIIRLQPITRIPNGPRFMEGVTNLRGHVIPVLDLRRRFGLEAPPATRQSRIVVAELGDFTVGMIVDAVSEVLRIPTNAVEPPSALLPGSDPGYLRGVAKVDERLVLLVELSRILALDEHMELSGAA